MTHRRPVRVMDTLRSRQRGDALVDDRVHDLEAGTDRQGQQSLASEPASSAIATLTTSGSATSPAVAAGTAFV